MVIYLVSGVFVAGVILLVTWRLQTIRTINEKIDALDFKANVVDYGNLADISPYSDLYPVDPQKAYAWYYQDTRTPVTESEILNAPLHDVFDKNELLVYRVLYLHGDAKDFIIYSKGPDGVDDSKGDIDSYNSLDIDNYIGDRYVLRLPRMISPHNDIGFFNFSNYDILIRPPYRLVDSNMVQFRKGFDWAGIENAYD